MVKHFETKAEAKAHLNANGWNEHEAANGQIWISADSTCRAVIVELPNTEVVQVHAWLA